MKTSFWISLFIIISNNLFSQVSGNPIIKNIFTMDPSALVSNDTLFIMTGHEATKTPYNWPFMAKDWHVFSTNNMKDYTDHGAILSADDFVWMNSKNCWASQCVEKDNKFYWYVCDFGNIGVAVSDNVLGPYKDALGQPLLSRDLPEHRDILSIDPSVFIDDDGKAYIFWGGQGKMKMSRLKDNLIELEGEAIEIKGLKGLEEAPWVFKRNDIYYLAYSASHGYDRGPIRYATSDSPLGPWIDRDDILGVAYNSFTNHEAIIEYKNQWYIIYHNGALQGGGDYARSVCVDKLYFNQDGSIQFVEQTTGGPLGLNAYNNFGPNTYAGLDATAALPYPVILNSKVIDDGRAKKPLTWSWHVLMGAGDITVPDNPSNEAVIHFTKPGDYTLKLTASDGYNETSDSVNIKVYAEPKGKTYEAESAMNTFKNMKITASKHTSGGKVVGPSGVNGELVFNNINVKENGVYPISIYYSVPKKEKLIQIKAHDKIIDTILPATAMGYTTSFGILSLNIQLIKGDNSINFLSSEQMPVIDKIVLGNRLMF